MCSHASVCMCRLLEVVNAGENNADILYIMFLSFSMLLQRLLRRKQR